jgi:hypothetical protein
MRLLFIVFWLIVLVVGWITSSTTIVNDENVAKSFKIKSFFFWLSIATSIFGSYYLFN